ncbi:MAG TPA: hypothetical protein DDY91_01425 [Planctomycetaceae bacterium]|nr:hypothetical protein [Planctomycetaceae bacterium]
MRGWMCSVVLCGLASVVSAAEPPLDEHLKPFAPLVGKTWKGEFKNSTADKPTFDTMRWEVALKGKAIRTRHAVNDGIYGGETLILWDPVKKQIVSYYFTTAGFRTEAAFEIKEGKFYSTELVHGLPGGVTEVTAVSEFKEGRFHVKSRRKVNDTWVDGHEVTYRQVADDTPIPVD